MSTCMCQALSLNVFLLSHKILTKTLRGQSCCCPHVTEEETEYQQLWNSTRQLDPGPILLAICREMERLDKWLVRNTRKSLKIIILIIFLSASKLMSQFSAGHYAHINQLKWSFKNHTQLNLKEKCLTESIYLEPFFRLGENMNVVMLHLPRALEFRVPRLTCCGLLGAHQPTGSYVHRDTYTLWQSDNPSWHIWFSSHRMHYCLSSSCILYFLLVTRMATTNIYF